jgi:hypothetical protein
MTDTTQYAQFIEHNEWEGETWSFWIPLDGNENALNNLLVAMDDFNTESYELDLAPISESKVDAFVKHADIGYMAAHNKLSGKLVLPDDLSAMLADEDGKDPLYKGGIRNLMHEQEAGTE